MRYSTVQKGRPRRHKIDALKAKAWYFSVAMRAGTKSAYAMENRFLNNQIQRENGITNRPCLFDKYKRGKHVPSRKLIERVGKEFPDTRKLADYPFWRVAKFPMNDLNELYNDLAKLRKPIVDLLFFPPYINNYQEDGVIILTS